jgi:hypothetical protein
VSRWPLHSKRQLELAAGETHRLAVDVNRHGVEARNSVFAAVHRRVDIPSIVLAAKHRANARCQLAKAEGLGDVVVCADVESRNAVAFAERAVSMMIAGYGTPRRR